MVLTTQAARLLGKTGCLATFYKQSFGTLISNTSWVQKSTTALPHLRFHTTTVFSSPSTVLLQISPSFPL